MTHPQESRVSSTQDTFRLNEENHGISSVEALLKKLSRNSSLGANAFQDGGKAVHVPPTSNQEEGKMEKMFPWLSRFWELCRSSVGIKNIQVLDNLLTVYLRNVSGNVKDCHMKPNRAAMLRKSMNDVLVFFHIFYQDMKESMEHSSCLQKMTELVAMYMDMEIQASRRRKESVKKVARRLTSSLFSFLDNSEEHMLDAILRTKYINKSSREVCVPVLGKILNRAPTYAMYEAMYVRYLLAFKLWKKVVANAEERQKINKIAVSRLNPPPNFLEKSKFFNDVLPKMPKSGKNITLFFMQAKFNLKNACATFLKMCKESHPDGFAHSLSLGMDKPIYFPDRLTLSGLADRGEYIGGSTNLTSDIWSSFSTGKTGLSEISPLKDILGKKPGSENCIGKKKNKNKDKTNKKKVKNKTEDKKDKILSACDKGLKKKAKKKLGLDIGDIVANINLGSHVSLLKKKKIKKKGLDLGDISKNDSTNLNQLKKTGKVKKEKKVQVLSNELILKSISIDEEQLNEVEITEEKCQEVEVETKVSTIIDSNEVKDNTESVGLITVRSDTQVSEALNELTSNQEDKVQNNEKSCVNIIEVENDTTLPTLPDVVSSQTCVENVSVVLNQVNLVNSVGSEEVQEHRVIVKVDERPESAVPSSTSSTSTNILIDTVPSVENEAVAVKRTEITPVDTMSPKNVRDPVLVSSQSACTQVPKSEPYVCDSSEVPLSGDEDCGPVVNDFSTVPIDIDTDVQILSDLRPRAAVKCDGEEEEIVLGDEGNIFNTGNEDLVRDIFVQFPVPYCHNDEGVAFEPTDCHTEEAVAFETADCHNDEGVAFGSTDGCETLYMYNLFTSLRGSFSQYGRKAQNFIERDFNLGEVMMELDENHSDDDSERGYEFASSCEQNYASGERHPVRGGKVMPTGVISSTSYSNVNEKESSDSSPSSGIDNDADSYLSSSYQKAKSSSFSSDSVQLSSGETPHPHIAVNTSALTVPVTPQNSKKFPTMNSVRCYPSAMECASPSETCTERTDSSTNRKNMSEEAEMSTPKRIHVRDLKQSEKVKSSAYNRVNVPSQFNQDSSDSPRSVALASEKVSEPQVKDPPKSTRGMLLENSIPHGNKYNRPMVNGVYAPMSPQSLSYSQMSQPLPMNKLPSFASYLPCTCSSCYAHHLMLLSTSYRQSQDSARFSQVPLQYCNPVQEEIVKSENQEILRKIEESLDDSIKLEKDPDDIESKYKTDLDSSLLPLKKRLTLAHVAETKVKQEKIVSEGFPSYPKRPMISIAELEAPKDFITKNFVKYIKSPNMPRYVPYGNYLFQPQFLNHEIPVKKLSNEKQHIESVPQYQSPNIPTNEVTEKKLQTYSCEPVVEMNQQRYSQNFQMQYNTNNPIPSNLEYSGRQFKTPAQLKEIPMDIGSVELSKQADSNIDVVSSTYNLSGSPESKQYILDLTLEESKKSSKSHKSSRRRKSHSSSSEGRTKGSHKRSSSVIQNAETVDDFMKSFESKRRRKHTSR